MKILTCMILMTLTLTAWGNPTTSASLDSQIEVQRRINNISIQEDDLKALEDLGDSLGRLDSWLDRRVQAIEEENRRREEEHARIMEIMMNIERYECEDVPYLPEIEEECLDDYYVEEGDSCYYEEVNYSLAR